MAGCDGWLGSGGGGGQLARGVSRQVMGAVLVVTTTMITIMMIVEVGCGGGCGRTCGWWVHSSGSSNLVCGHVRTHCSQTAVVSVEKAVQG